MKFAEGVEMLRKEGINPALCSDVVRSVLARRNTYGDNSTNELWEFVSNAAVIPDGMYVTDYFVANVMDKFEPVSLSDIQSDKSGVVKTLTTELDSMKTDDKFESDDIRYWHDKKDIEEIVEKSLNVCPRETVLDYAVNAARCVPDVDIMAQTDFRIMFKCADDIYSQQQREILLQQEKEDGNRVKFLLMGTEEYLKYAEANALSSVFISNSNVRSLISGEIACENKSFQDVYAGIKDAWESNFYDKAWKSNGTGQTEPSKISAGVFLYGSPKTGDNLYLVAVGQPACGCAKGIENQRFCNAVLHGLDKVKDMAKSASDKSAFKACKALRADYDRNGYEIFGNECYFADGTHKTYKPTKEDKRMDAELGEALKDIFNFSNSTERRYPESGCDESSVAANDCQFE